MGGCNDSSYLDGHSFTYEGSKPGMIVDILQKAHCMNPVIYFDELDKISETTKGDEIVNLLIHLTDTSQNSQFTDKYLGNNINIDLSEQYLCSVSMILKKLTLFYARNTDDTIN